MLLDDSEEYDCVWDRVYKELGFRPGMKESVPFEIHKPYTVYGIGNMTEPQIDKLEVFGKEIFARISPGRVYALDWHHSAFLYDSRNPDEQKSIFTDEENGYYEYFPPFYPDGDYYFFIDESFNFGLLGHPWRQEIWIFGEPLLSEFKKIYAELGWTVKEI